MIDRQTELAQLAASLAEIARQLAAASEGLAHAAGDPYAAIPQVEGRERPAPSPEGAILLTVAEAAEKLRLGETTVRNLIAEGHLPVVHVGRAVRVRPEDLAAFTARLHAEERARSRSAPWTLPPLLPRLGR